MKITIHDATQRSVVETHGQYEMDSTLTKIFVGTLVPADIAITEMASLHWLHPQYIHTR